jgi:ABC-2 type transport system ATP-binding protein
VTDEMIKKAISSVGLNPESSEKVKTYSLGMKQKLSIAQALFENPSILLLDEPTNALDEEGVKLIRNILIEEKKKGKLIIIASHNKEDLNLLSDVTIKVSDGKFSK